MTPLVAGVCYAPDNYWYAVGYDYDGRNTIIRTKYLNDPQYWSTNMLNASSAYFGVYSPGNPAVGADIASDGKNTLVAVGYASPTNSAILWADTKDGTMWYNATLEDGVTYVPSAGGIVYNGTLWVSVGVDGIMVSRNGKLWKIVATPYLFGGMCVGWNGQYWMVGGASRGINTASIYYSYDGFDWLPTTVPPGVDVQAICWSGTHWIAGGQNFGSFVAFADGFAPAAFIRSIDGVVWEGSTGNNFDVQVNGIANRIRLPNAAPPAPFNTLTGSGPPPLSFGKPGDLYFDKETSGFYGPKTETTTLGSNGSILFTPSGGTVSSDPSSDFVLTSDFTIQFWMKATLFGGNIFDTQNVLPQGQPGTFILSMDPSGRLVLQVDTSTEVIPTSVVLDEWVYGSMVRSSASGLIIYSNGSNVYSNVDYATNTIGNPESSITIGAGLNGNITNFQWVNGYADPSANIVPMQPLTALSGANLLLLAPVDLSAVLEQPTPVFIDSTGNYTMTTTGNVLWSGDNPFQTTTLSWGTATLPPRGPIQFTGYGVPLSDPSGSRLGDTFLDLSTGRLYNIVP
jgi:hypothetical protein